MGKKVRKLSLNRETVRKLDSSEMRGIAGGFVRTRMDPHRPGKIGPVFYQSNMCPSITCTVIGCSAVGCSL